MIHDLSPFLMHDGWYFFADGRSHGPYRAVRNHHRDRIWWTGLEVAICLGLGLAFWVVVQR